MPKGLHLDPYVYPYMYIFVFTLIHLYIYIHYTETVVCVSAVFTIYVVCALLLDRVHASVQRS